MYIGLSTMEYCSLLNTKIVLNYKIFLYFIVRLMYTNDGSK